MLPTLLNREPIRSALHSVRRFYYRERLTSARLARRAVGQVDAQWRQRIDDVLASPDNLLIPRVPGAGTLDRYFITMHNGVRVCANGYYGEGILNMLMENRGVHEPQEERAFDEIIECVPDACCMLELGAYWGFYSLSLLNRRPAARCYLVEPEEFNILSGKLNFRLNGRAGTFIQALVGAAPSTAPPTISVDSVCAEHGIQHLHILHSDIQGHELAMLAGAHDMLSRGRVDYVFISTHSNDLHAACLRELLGLGYAIVAEANLDESYSVDGLIVARRSDIERPAAIDISKRHRPS